MARDTFGVKKARNPKAPANARCSRGHPLSPHARKKKRQEEAQSRQKAYDALSIEARLVLAQSRPGESKREVNRLKNKLAK